MDRVKVSLIVTTHNQLQYSKIMFESLTKYTCHPYELVWVDTLSTDGTREWLKSPIHKKTIKVLLNQRTGLGQAMNRGFRECDPESKYIGDLDNDLILTENWLTKMVNHMEANPKVAALTMVSTTRNKGVMPYAFNYRNLELVKQQVRDFSRKLNKQYKLGKQTGIKITRWCNGCHTLFRREALEQVNLWNPELWIGEDKDIVRRLGCKGWNCAIALNVWVYHFQGRTFKKIRREDPEWYEHMLESGRLLDKLYPKTPASSLTKTKKRSIKK